jgi:hypothetical protein
MTTDEARKTTKASCGRWTDSLFVGVGVVPLVLLVGGLADIALLLFIPLLLGACLCGMWEQVG